MEGGVKIKKQKYLPMVISGCSGVGKGTIINCLINDFPELFELSVSFTTRKPRPGEVQGKHYFFVTKEDFEKAIKQNGFLQHCQVHGNYYGTSTAFVQSVIDKGKICLLDIDIQGAQKVHSQHENWNYLFIQPPSMQELQKRLRGRNTETEQAIQKRTTNARKQMQKVKELKFYRHLVNDEVVRCYKQFVDIINQSYHLLIAVQQ